MQSGKLKTAIIYDFDGTLARGNLQERTFIPDLGMSPTEFWQIVMDRAEAEDADEILTYMHLMLEKSHSKGIPLTKELLHQHGRAAALFSGLSDRSWFIRLNEHSAQRGLDLQHFIVSSGNLEMIRGCPIFDAFNQVYASKYLFKDGVAAWPSVAINYTTKTQYLFRINKGIANNWNHRDLNAFTPDDERPIGFDRMIFIGDGDTDIPTMKMLKHKGGQSIAVYDPKRETKDLSKIHSLISDDRVDFVAPADYSENTQLDIVVKGILGRIARRHGYRPPKSHYA